MSISRLSKFGFTRHNYISSLMKKEFHLPYLYSMMVDNVLKYAEKRAIINIFDAEDYAREIEQINPNLITLDLLEPHEYNDEYELSGEAKELLLMLNNNNDKNMVKPSDHFGYEDDMFRIKGDPISDSIKRLILFINAGASIKKILNLIGVITYEIKYGKKIKKQL